MRRQRTTGSAVFTVLCVVALLWWFLARPGTSASSRILGLQQDGQGWSLGGLAIEPGQVADFSVSVLNKSKRPITLKGVRLIAGEKERLPLLAHLAVFNGNGIAGSSSGWPPKDTSPVVALRGYSGAPGWIEIAVGLTGRKPNVVYGIIGVTLTFSQNGTTYQSVVTGSGGQFCVVSKKDAKSCLRRIEAIQNKYY
jgi:hypothetical protein